MPRRRSRRRSRRVARVLAARSYRAADERCFAPYNAWDASAASTVRDQAQRRFGVNRLTSAARASSAQRIVHEPRLPFRALLPVYVYS